MDVTEGRLLTNVRKRKTTPSDVRLYFFDAVIFYGFDRNLNYENKNQKMCLYGFSIFSIAKTATYDVENRCRVKL